jgi:hypothetical protein
VVVEMQAHGAAAAGTVRLDDGNAEAIEHARRGGVDVGRHGGLYTAGQHEHAAPVVLPVAPCRGD